MTRPPTTLDPAKIRQARADRSQSDVAAAAGMSQQHYALIEAGKRCDPKLSTAIAIAAALAVPLESLLTRLALPTKKARRLRRSGA